MRDRRGGLALIASLLAGCAGATSSVSELEATARLVATARVGATATWPLVASAGMWRLASVYPLTPLRPAQLEVLDVASSGDGRLIAVATQESIELFDGATLARLGPVADSGGRGRRALALSPTGHWLACGESTGLLRMWSLDSGRLLLRVAPASAYTQLASHPSLGPPAPAVARDRALVLSDDMLTSAGDASLDQFSSDGRARTQTDYSSVIAISPDSRLVVDDDGHTQLLFDAEEGTAWWLSATQAVRAAFSASGRFLALHEDRTLTVWDLHAFANVLEDSDFDASASEPVFDASERTVAMLDTQEPAVRLCTLASPQQCKHVRLEPGGPFVAITPRPGTDFALVDAHARLRALTQPASIQTAPEPEPYQLELTQAEQVRISPALDRLVFEPNDGAPLAVPLLAAMGREVVRMELQEAKQPALSRYADALFPRYVQSRTPYAWFFWNTDASTLQALPTSTTPDALVGSHFAYAAVISNAPNATDVCMGRVDGRVTFPRPSAFQMLGDHPIVVRPNALAFAAWSCASRALTGAEARAGQHAEARFTLHVHSARNADAVLEVRDSLALSAAPVITLDAPELSFVVSSDGNQLATADAAGIKVWELASQYAREWRDPSQRAFQLYAVSNDGRHVAAAKDEHTLCIVNTSGTEPIELATEQPATVQFSRDSESVVIVDRSGLRWLRLRDRSLVYTELYGTDSSAIRVTARTDEGLYSGRTEPIAFRLAGIHNGVRVPSEIVRRCFEREDLVRDLLAGSSLDAASSTECALDALRALRANHR